MTNTISNNVSSNNSSVNNDEAKLKEIAAKFIGLSKNSGQNKAENSNLIFRLIRKDGEAFMDYPSDSRTDRVCVEIDKGEITKATIQ